MGRRRPTPHRLRTEAKRRTAQARLSCLARNGHPGSPRGAPRGVVSAGEESRDAPLRHRRSRRQPAFGQIAQQKRPFGAGYRRKRSEDESDLAGFHKLQRKGGSETQRVCWQRVLVLKPALNRRPNNAVEPQSPTRHRKICCRWRRNPNSHDQGLAHGGAFELHPPLCFGIFAGEIGRRPGEDILVAGVAISYCDDAKRPLGAAVALAARGKSLTQVGATMFVFGAGAAAPLLGVGLISRKILSRWRYRLLSGGKAAKAALGAVLILVGVLIASGLDRKLETILVAASPAWLTALTTKF